jgi:hypothetical protein
MNDAGNVARLTVTEKLAVLFFLSYPHTPLKFSYTGRDKWHLIGEGLPVFRFYTLSEAVLAAISYVDQHYREWKTQKRQNGHRWSKILMDIDDLVSGVADDSWLDEQRCCLKRIPKKYSGRARGRFRKERPS